MKIILSILILHIAILAAPDSLKQDIPITFSHKDAILTLNGIGIRTFLGISIYRAGLYLLKNNQNATEIIEEEKPMSIRLWVTSGLITSDRLGKTKTEVPIHSTL